MASRPAHDGWLYLAMGRQTASTSPRPGRRPARLQWRAAFSVAGPDGRDPAHFPPTGLRNIYDVALDAELKRLHARQTRTTGRHLHDFASSIASTAPTTGIRFSLRHAARRSDAAARRSRARHFPPGLRFLFGTAIPDGVSRQTCSSPSGADPSCVISVFIRRQRLRAGEGNSSLPPGMPWTPTRSSPRISSCSAAATLMLADYRRRSASQSAGAGASIHIAYGRG